MKAYNKRRRPKHHTKPRWEKDGKLFRDPITDKMMVEVVQYHLVGHSVYPEKYSYFLATGSTCNKSRIVEYNKQQKYGNIDIDEFNEDWED